ncbi:hypothetical protein T484DRAFT_1757844, partial [Baffinella frigidus]
MLPFPAVSVSVLDLDEIDVERERFACTLRIFAMWTVDLAPLEMPVLEERVARSGNFHTLTADEVGEFRRRSDVPKLSIVNSVSVEPVDEEAIRVYGKVEGAAKQWVLWTNVFRVLCQTPFTLRDYPFDRQ